MYKIVHYINQFYAGMGGEEMATTPLQQRAGAVGPGTALAAALQGEAEISATIICGDSFFNENLEQVRADIKQMLLDLKPDLLIAGPAFNAGRYGIACGTVASMAKEMGILALSGMYQENPGAEMFKDQVYIVSTGDSAASMRKAVPTMAALAKKMLRGEEIGASVVEGYLPNGVRKNFFESERGSSRAVSMLLKKLAGQPYTTEYPMPDFDRVAPAAALRDLAHAKIALVTSGGIVPKGNPDHIESSSASHYGKYDLSNVNDLTAEGYETAHGGYDPVYANADADRVLPVDVLRDLEKEGKIGSLSQYWYSTVGNGTAVASSKEFAAEVAQELLADQVQAVILTST